MEEEIKNIVIIGSGNVAFHLIRAFCNKDIAVLQILARNEKTAKVLSSAFNIPYIIDPAQLNKKADLYILAVQDDLIRETALSLKLDRQLLVHTSGYTSIDVLEKASANTGVIWPLQTLSKSKTLDYRMIPFFIEGNSRSAEVRLHELISKISKKINITDSPTRQKIHLAAVIASNLTNHLYSISESILAQHDIPFEVLEPLILETARKAGKTSPRKVQTGPASRNDRQVIDKHLELLKDDPEAKEIYRLITEHIIHKQNS